MKYLGLSLIALASLLITACATMSTDGAAGTGEQSAQDLIAKAEEAYKAVNKKGAAWRDTEEMIENAKKELANKNEAGAVALAQEALAEAMNADKQFESEKKAGPWLF